MEITGEVHCFFEQEEWRDIEGFEGLYQVSNCGKVKAYKGRLEPTLAKLECLRKKYYGQAKTVLDICL